MRYPFFYPRNSISNSHMIGIANPGGLVRSGENPHSDIIRVIVRIQFVIIQRQTSQNFQPVLGQNGGL